MKQVQENLEHYQAATQQLRQEQSLLMEKKQNEYEQKFSLLLTQVNTAISEKSAYLAQYDQLTKVHESLVNEHKTLATQYGEIRSQHEFLKMAHDKVQHDNHAIKMHNQAQATELTTLQRAIVELQLNIKSREEKISSLEDAMVRANDKIEALRHENHFVLQEKANLDGQLKQMQSSGTVRAVG